MSIKHVTVLGAGVLGAQIAYRAAHFGYQVISYDIDEASLALAQKRFETISEMYLKENHADSAQVIKTRSQLSLSCQLEEAVKDADIIIEAVPENLALKQEIWEKVGKLAKDSAIFATNTSTLLPSQMAQSSGAAERFLALHFANNIHRQNIVEIMGHQHTNPDIVRQTEAFGKSIGMDTIVIAKEQAGYVLNSLLVPFLDAAARLYGNEIAAPKDIDTVWKKGTGSPIGPFEAMDIIGLRTVYAVHSQKANAHKDPAVVAFVEKLKSEYLDKGRMGVETKAGFYDYD